MRNRVARWVGLPTGDGSIRRVRLAKTPCAVSRGSSAKQASIVLFMFKHCFHYDFTIGFVCGSWLRLRKASLSVGFVWLMRSSRPKGSSATAVDLSVGFVWPKQEGSCPTAASLRPHGRLARSVNSATVDASAREAAGAERCEAKPIMSFPVLDLFYRQAEALSSPMQPFTTR
jgi:hypothetical protein